MAPPYEELNDDVLLAALNEAEAACAPPERQLRRLPHLPVPSAAPHAPVCRPRRSRRLGSGPQWGLACGG
eukprot:5108660-Pleurochrysis_carterae.AAC.1